MIYQLLSNRTEILAIATYHITIYATSIIISDVVKTLMVETETKTKTWKKFETKAQDQHLKKFSRLRSRLREFVRDRDETSRPEILEAKLIRIDY